jgi:hypothetical protein
MANPTTNYGFVLPTATDLVTDLPADFDVALQGVDTRLKALQPGTTLGDLAYSSATANTNTRLALGTAGQVLKVNSGATAPEWGSISASPTSANSFVSTSETTATTTTLADLATVQALTVTTGTKVLVLLTAEMSIATSGGNGIGRFGVAVSGATTRSANADEDGFFGMGTFTSGNKTRNTSSIYLTCTAGSNTFTMKFASGQFGVASTFSNRRMTIIDLGS